MSERTSLQIAQDFAIEFEQRIDAALRLHREQPNVHFLDGDDVTGRQARTQCIHCHTPYPCATVRALTPPEPPEEP